ncbi:MAG: DUF721 domain-containing protein [Acidobacteria bacterium]|nr:DUF721 domain-containing protein [Acidobacteriota bacterium]
MERAGRLIGKLKLCATPEELARAAWPAAVGKRIAAHSAAVRLDGSCLVVEVEDTVWQGHLMALRSQIVKRMEEVLGSALVGRLAFWPMLPRRMPQREERVARRADEADDIADPEMRRLYKVARRKATA